MKRKFRRKIKPIKFTLTSTQKKNRRKRRLRWILAMLFVAAVVVSVVYFDDIKSSIELLFPQENTVVKSADMAEDTNEMNVEQPDVEATSLPETTAIVPDTDKEENTFGEKVNEEPSSKPSPTPAPTKEPVKKKPSKPKFSFHYSFGKVVDGKVVDVDSDDECWVVQFVLSGKRPYKPYNNEVKRIAKKIKSFKKKYITPKMSKYDKARAIHDYLVRNVHYRSNRDDLWKYDAYGALVNHYAVCAGYAKAFELMCACCEIKCHLVEGETKDGSRDGHAWNIAKIGGKWRHVDVTWDDPTPERNQDGIEHTYFNVTDRFISKDHTWERRDYPKCR